MKTKTVAAEDVVVGDYVYNASATHEAFRWVRVVNLGKNLSGKYTVINTTVWDTWKHPKEAVVIKQRSE